MSATLDPLPTSLTGWNRWLTKDYCPGLEPYIQWLRQPIAWFLCATLASCLVGAFLSPMGWSLAAGLIALMAIGIAYPWLSVYGTTCQIISSHEEIEEGQTTHVTVTVRNHCPWPTSGLIIEGYLVHPEPICGEDPQPSGDVALATIPWLSCATFRVPMQPEYRGHYPRTAPKMTCAFPFAIWKAARSIEQVDTIVVRPRRERVVSLPEHQGTLLHHCGTGSRAGGNGDFIGLRAYREGDSLRSVHWAHTAKSDSIVVCERGASQQACWSVELDASSTTVSRGQRENLAWRVRIATSLCALLHQRSVPFELTIRGEENWSDNGVAGGRSRATWDGVVDRLTNVPLDVAGLETKVDPCASAHDSAKVTTSVRMRIEPIHAASMDLPFYDVQSDKVRVTLECGQPGPRLSQQISTVLIDLSQDVGQQLNAWLQKAEQGSYAA